MIGLDVQQTAEAHLKWLVDPLPVDLRVIASVDPDRCPPVWKWALCIIPYRIAPSCHSPRKLLWPLGKLLLHSSCDLIIRMHVSEMCNHCVLRSWPSLTMEEMSNRNVRELLRAELSSHGSSLSAEHECRILTHCRTPSTCSPLYVILLVTFLAKWADNIYSCTRKHRLLSFCSKSKQSIDISCACHCDC